MRTESGGIHRAWMVLIPAAAIACGTVLNIEDSEPDPTVDAGAGEGGEPNIDGGEPDIGEILPGTDGAADDAAPISPDGGLDAALPPGCPGAPACDRVVFVTSETYAAGEAKTADNACQMRAANSPFAVINTRKFQAARAGRRSAAQRSSASSAPRTRAGRTSTPSSIPAPRRRASCASRSEPIAAPWDRSVRRRLGWGSSEGPLPPEGH